MDTKFNDENLNNGCHTIKILEILKMLKFLKILIIVTTNNLTNG